MNVELLEVMGSDLTVVNAARVSFAAESSEFDTRDKNRIKYLAKHKHMSPFGHAFASFHVKAPIFVARQLVKHKFLRWNEISRRYVDDEPEFYIPSEWRLKADDKKQGSSDETIEYNLGSTLEFIKTTYQNMLKANIAPEMARMVLPQNMMTEWYWTGSVMAFARVCNLRNKEDSQEETRMITIQMTRHLKDHFPISAKYLLDEI
mgnify:CR=1 FL=1